MARKKRKFEMNIHPADKWMENMKFKDLKRECVVRGMPFEQAVSSSIPQMAQFLKANFHEKTQHELLDKFDDWQEQQILAVCKEKGEDPKTMIHPSLRLGYIAEKDDDGNTIKRKRVRVIVGKKKIKRERTEDGLFTGTKKAYTFQLQQDGLSKDEVIEKVKDQFPDASEKSIGIWFNKSRKLHKK